MKVHRYKNIMMQIIFVTFYGRQKVWLDYQINTK